MALKTADLRNLTKDELNIKLSALKVDLYNLRSQAETGRIEKPHRIKQIKRDLARILTIMKEVDSKNASESKKA